MVKYFQGFLKPDNPKKYLSNVKKVKYFQGFFKPNNPKKYLGNVENICYRSGLEFKVMRKLDADPSIVSWASEEFYIPYKSPIDNYVHRYFVDLFFERIENGKKQKYICEVKPFSQCSPPQNSKGKRLIKETVTYAINEAKWSAAKFWATKRDCKFIILTEKDIG